MPHRRTDPQHAERSRELIRKLVDTRFAGNVTHAAAEMHIPQSTLARYLSGKHGQSGPTQRVLDGVARIDPELATRLVRRDYAVAPTPTPPLPEHEPAMTDAVALARRLLASVRVSDECRRDQAIAILVADGEWDERSIRSAASDISAADNALSVRGWIDAIAARLRVRATGTRTS